MQVEQRSSGLIVPKEKPKQPPRKFGLLEIRDDEQRETAKEALSKLWDAMGLSSGGDGIQLPGGPHPGTHRAHYRLYRMVGDFLLGDECPEKEQLT